MLWEVAKEGAYVLCFSCLGFFCLFVSKVLLVEVLVSFFFFGNSKSMSSKKKLLGL